MNSNYLTLIQGASAADSATVVRIHCGRAVNPTTGKDRDLHASFRIVGRLLECESDVLAWLTAQPAEAVVRINLPREKDATILLRPVYLPAVLAGVLAEIWGVTVPTVPAVKPSKASKPKKDAANPPVLTSAANPPVTDASK